MSHTRMAEMFQNIDLVFITSRRNAPVCGLLVTTHWLWFDVSGTFQNIEHVFIVGVAGGVPQFADYYRHPRLGDIIFSKCDSKGYLYYYCDKITQVNYDVSPFYHSESTHKGVNELSKDVSQTQQQRPELPAVTLTWHAGKCEPGECYHKRLGSLLLSQCEPVGY